MHDIRSRVTERSYTASPRVADVIAKLDRTEDVRFSPNNRRLAVAAFRRNRIVVFDVTVSPTAEETTGIVLDGGVELLSPAFKRPHGLDFLDDDTIVVTSRAGTVSVFGLPSGGADFPSVTVEPMQTWPAGAGSLLFAPGSVAVVPTAADRREVLICNNNSHTVTRHLLDWPAGGGLASRADVLLAKWLDIPDGVAVSGDGRWLAVSNHYTHSVLMYERTAGLNTESDPDGILRRVSYPHGLRFSPDGRHLVVADAGAPYLHVYAQGAEGWRGVQPPAASIRVMSDEQFQKGRYNPMEGGPKGVDVDRSGRVVVVTSEMQPLAFFDLAPLVARTRIPEANMAFDISHEIHMMDEHRRLKASVREARSLTAYMRNSLSWRLTAPLRRLHTVWQSITNAK